MDTVQNYRLPDGSIYSGECKKDSFFVELKGNGKILYPNGDSFIGNFDNGYVRGFGKYRFFDGDIHTGWFYDGIPNGIGYLNHHSSMALGLFKDGKLNGWGIQVNQYGFNFGWWKENVLIQKETKNVQWIKTQIDLALNVYKNSIVSVSEQKKQILFGIPKLKRKSIIDNTEYIQPAMGFLFNNTGEVLVGDKIYEDVTGWFVKYQSNQNIVYGYWKNGILEREGSLSNFQSTIEDIDLLPF